MQKLKSRKNKIVSQVEWIELVHDALHSLPNLVEWHNYVEGLDDRPALIVYDQLNRIKKWGKILAFGPSFMCAYDWGQGNGVVPSGRAYYTPEDPSKFLVLVFRNFVKKEQCVDFAKLRAHLAVVDRRYSTTSAKASKRLNGVAGGKM